MVLMCKNDTPNTEANAKSKTEIKSKKTIKKETDSKVKKSADYSSLLIKKMIYV